MDCSAKDAKSYKPSLFLRVLGVLCGSNEFFDALAQRKLGQLPFAVWLIRECFLRHEIFSVAGFDFDCRDAQNAHVGQSNKKGE
jgi:hypothetical protein